MNGDGTLAQGWRKVRLGDVCHITWGNTAITKRSYVPSGHTAFSATGPDGFLETYDYDQKAIILSAIGARCGKCFFAKGKWTAIKNTIVIWPKDDRTVDIDFLFQYLNREEVWPSDAMAQPFITMRRAASVLVPLPPIEEERRIAARLREQLSILAEARAALEAQLKAAEALPAVNLRAVFESEEAQRWPRRRLGDITTKIGSGFTPLGGHATYKSSGIPLIRSQNVLINSFTTDGLAFISKEQDDEMKSSRVQSGDVLLNITGASIGRVCVAPRDICPANVNQHVSVIRSNGELDPRFLSFFVSSPEFQKFIWRTQAGATRQALTKQIIENFVVPAPSVEIQRAIATRLDEEFSASTTLRESVEGKLSELEKLPAALMRTAFSRNGD